LKANPAALPWWMHLFIHAADGALIGLGGYKGVPDEGGAVEIGYSLAPAYRGQGLATEAARGLIANALESPQVTRVDAHTLAEKNPSTRVLQRVGMRFVQAKLDPDDGEIWHWSVTREEYKAVTSDE
jgi:[ribosomal protein S5]-alanine N-acetyltransferase